MSDLMDLDVRLITGYKQKHIPSKSLKTPEVDIMFENTCNQY